MASPVSPPRHLTWSRVRHGDGPELHLRDALPQGPPQNAASAAREPGKPQRASRPRRAQIVTPTRLGCPGL
ncbi:hypothetical protein B0T26DRAFT_725132 [Lasiosphaeria miniovina]|uniref:Uncharacterized protein n=1 Tax=Lasiosphaeria miniovina TaxID=1954250 RepID=A0AA40DJK3_9PEZI|nr:uncharacterized protein B0T26DRAFT_725132 [Lasiosphaeria miniovina]KAK0705979.1 hypothetical protein B0T26DRAFT_725132 [Lasiosphaeria miniovina]